MKNYYVYILQCADDSYYTGVTNNIERRHQEGLNTSCYTYKRRPLKLVYFQLFHDINHAIATEKQIKGWSRKKKEALINSEWGDLVRLSKNYKEFGKPL